MVQPPAHLPDLTHLYRTNLVDRLLDVTFGGGTYTEPTQFQVTTAARLLDKCLNEWDLAVEELEAHAQVREGVAPPLLSPRPGVTRAFFRAIDHFETLVDSLARLLRLLQALSGSPELSNLTSAMPLLSKPTCDRIRNFRNRIAHGDEDIEQGKAGQGFATATLRIDPPVSSFSTRDLTTQSLPRSWRRSTTTCARCLNRALARSSENRLPASIRSRYDPQVAERSPAWTEVLPVRETGSPDDTDE